MRFLPLLLLVALAPQDPVAVTGRVVFPEGSLKVKPRHPSSYKDASQRKHKKDPDLSYPVVWLEGLPSAKAKDAKAEMKQVGLEFRPRVLAIQAGTTVRFPNGDPFHHNIFSYAKANRFDVGRLEQGESKDVHFDVAGRVDVNCELHDNMRGFIVVVDHSCFAVAAEDGRFTLPAVPPGTYTLVAWQESLGGLRQEVEVKAGMAPVDLKFVKAGQPGESRRITPACCDE